MVRRVAILWLTLAALLCQPLALAQPAPGAAGGAGALSHALLHWFDLGHHHHDDGSVHFDGSAESQAHAAADPLGQPALQMHAGDTALALLPEAAPLPPHARAAGPPFLEGPLRPPRSPA
jgi:hypothetical protein